MPLSCGMLRQEKNCGSVALCSAHGWWQHQFQGECSCFGNMLGLSSLSRLPSFWLDHALSPLGRLVTLLCMWCCRLLHGTGWQPLAGSCSFVTMLTRRYTLIYIHLKMDKSSGNLSMSEGIRGPSCGCLNSSRCSTAGCEASDLGYRCLSHYGGWVEDVFHFEGVKICWN